MVVDNCQKGDLCQKERKRIKKELLEEERTKGVVGVDSKRKREKKCYSPAAAAEFAEDDLAET